MDIREIHDPRDPQVTRLVAESDAYLSARYPAESNHAESIESLIGPGSTFFVAVVNEQFVGCVAVKIKNALARYGELKCLFVRESHRSRGVATALVDHLEEYLLNSGIRLVRLEAGPMQPEALSLYSRLGYRPRGTFGHYTMDPLSVFMEKSL